MSLRMIRTLRQTQAAAADAGDQAAARRRRLGLGLVLALLLSGAAGLATGSEGFSLAALWADLQGPDTLLLIGQIRAPRTLGAALVGALLGLSGALAQGLFRNPLADPYLLGGAAGAGLAWCWCWPPPRPAVPP
jgi:iron complex transport system permease protein